MSLFFGKENPKANDAKASPSFEKKNIMDYAPTPANFKL